MRIKVMGKMWNLSFPRLDITKHRGLCDPPNLPNKSIKVACQLKDEESLEVLVHELIHSSGWSLLSEDYVSEFSRDLARVLWRLGYRRNQDEQK